MMKRTFTGSVAAILTPPKRVATAETVLDSDAPEAVVGVVEPPEVSANADDAGDKHG